MVYLNAEFFAIDLHSGSGNAGVTPFASKKKLTQWRKGAEGEFVRQIRQLACFAPLRLCMSKVTLHQIYKGFMFLNPTWVGLQFIELSSHGEVVSWS